MERNLFITLEVAFERMWGDVILFVPQIVLAVLVVIAGFMVGGILATVVMRVLTTIKMNSLLDKAGVDDLSAKAGLPFNGVKFIGSLIKWFVVLVFVVAALDILRLGEVTQFFREVVLTYVPKVIVAVLILFGGLILANVTAGSVTAGARAAGFKAAELLGSVARYAIIVFAVMAVLNQLEIAPELVQTLFMGIVFAASLAIGLAFGLGGKDAARDYIADMTGKGKSHH